MSPIAVAEEHDSSLIPAGRTLFQVVSYEATAHPKYGPGYRWILRTKSGQEIWLFTDQVPTKRGGWLSRYWLFVEAVFGRAIQPGEAVDSEKLVGRFVYANVEIVAIKGVQRNRLGTLSADPRQVPFALPRQPVLPSDDDCVGSPFAGE